jgi:Tol biopolymer transport system component
MKRSNTGHRSFNLSLQGAKGVIVSLFIVTLFISACAPNLTPPPDVDLHITIVADGNTIPLTTRAITVREALNEAGVALDPKDKLAPSEFTQLTEGLTITIVRVTEEFEVEQVVIPFSKKTVRNEGLKSGETRLLQTGENGSEEITYRIGYEDGIQVSRDPVRRVTLKQPTDEIVMIGAQTTFTAIPINGTLAYISAGSAWLMRDSSGSRKPLVTTGDLDGRVFTLSADGKYLLFSRIDTKDTTPGLHNSLWAISATEPNPKPFELKVKNVLWAGWSPTEDRTLAYTTAESRETAPGWQANNDLYLLTFDNRGKPDDPELLLESSAGGLYGWFGTNFIWSPDGSRLAFSQADQIGLVDTEAKTLSPIATYAIFQTYSDWVWNPSIAWSPDGRFIYTVLHGAPIGLEKPEDSRVFNVAAIAADGSFDASLIDQAGIWSNPIPSPDGELIAFMKAIEPLESLDGNYRLTIMDRDGSNAATIFPPPDQPGLRRDTVFAWSPDAKQLAVTVDGNLWIVDIASGKSQQLTGDGQTGSPVWVK